MNQKILIDGYNVLYEFPELRRKLEIDFEEARETLVDRLISYASAKSVDLVVVFDGDGKVTERSKRKKGIEIIFSKFPDKADPLIKRLIEKKQKQIDLIVVSSDKEIGNYAKLCGVRCITAKKFANEISYKPSIDAEKKYDYQLSQEELEEWMRLFSENKNGV